jgi:ABC-type transport system involved in cytochrome c biogenesis permease subunit
MLATVIRDSFRRGGPAPGAELFVFAASAFGLVSIPVMLVGVGLNSASNFEVLPTFVADILTFLLVAAAAGYALALVFARASSEGLPATNPDTDPRPLPGIAKAMENLALDADSTKKLTQMTYGVVCFATLLSFIGTVLGGIWADQSWGRFWGWDPKENGAVLIVLWNALILHARWCGLIRDRGIAVLAVVGNMITAWSWFGTNQLGIGLHAYGFDKRLAVGCRWFWLSQMVIIGLGLIPRSYWGGATRRLALSTPPATALATERLQPLATAAPTVNGSSAPQGQGKGKKPGKKK